MTDVVSYVESCGLRIKIFDFLAGNFRVNSKADIPEALEALKDRPLYSEKWAYFKTVRKLVNGFVIQH